MFANVNHEQKLKETFLKKCAQEILKRFKEGFKSDKNLLFADSTIPILATSRDSKNDTHSIEDS